MSNVLNLRCSLHKQTAAQVVVEGGRELAYCPSCGRKREAQAALQDAAEHLAAQEMHDIMRKQFPSRPKPNDLISITYDDSEFRRLREPNFILR